MKTEKAKNERLRRLKNRIYNLISNNSNCLFITLTFTNAILSNTNKETRERYIKAFLNNETSEYIANRDYGKTTKREHYHVIATPKHDLINYRAYKYGKIHAERINKLKRFTKNNKSLLEIASDLMKHTTKSSTKENKILFSRAKRKDNYLIDYTEIYDGESYADTLEIDDIIGI